MPRRKDTGVDPKELYTDTKPEKAAEPEKKGMADDEFQQLVTSRCQDAEAYVDEQIAHDREQATEYYNGRLPDIDKDDDEEDRSTAVLTEVRDTVLGMMPDLLRIFFGGQSVCKYLPVPVADLAKYKQNEEAATQATEYVQHVVLRADNPDSFTTFHSAFQDALVRKTGFIRYWWEKTKRPEYSRHTGLTLEDIAALIGDDGGEAIEIVSKRAYPNPDTTALAGRAVVYDVLLKRTCVYGKIRVRAIPCERFFINRTATGLESPTNKCFGYSEDRSVGDLVADGIDEKDLEDCDEESDDITDAETRARGNQNQDKSAEDDEAPTDPSQRMVKWSEAYILADRDGDGIAELIRVETVGTKFKVLPERTEACDDIQYAAFCPYPEAHSFFGHSVADLTMDVQRMKSRIFRDTLDSLAQAVQPITTIVEGQVNLDDALNPDTSKVIRQRAPGMYQPHVVPFVGKEAFPVLEFLTNVREARTGQSDASQGLDPKVLQSTDKDAVHATLSKAQSRIEMVARIFAETGMARLFRGILKLAIKHQDKPRTVRLRGGKVATIDPKSWNADMDVMPDVPLGRGSGGDQMAFLMGVAAKQEQIIQTLGPENKFCGIEHLHYTYAKMLEISGWQNTSSFFGDPTLMSEEEKKQMVQQMAQAMKPPQAAGPAAPDPQVEMAKIKANKEIKMAELQHKRDELAVHAQIEMSKINTDAQMRALEIQAQSGTVLQKTAIDAAVKTAGDQLKSETAVIVAKLKPKPTDKGEATSGEGSS